MKDILAQHGYYDPAYMGISVLQSKYKDWNEDLKAMHGVIPIPAVEHPKLELLPRVCAGLSGLCEALAPEKNIRSFLTDCGKNLEPLLASGKVLPENTDIVGNRLECLAAGSLLSIKDLCRQMERPVTTEQLVSRLQASYRLHEDKGWLRSRSEDIRRDLADIDRQICTPGIRGEEDQRRLCQSYLRLALDCVKTRMFVELEMAPMLPEQEQTENFIMTM